MKLNNNINNFRLSSFKVEKDVMTSEEIGKLLTVYSVSESLKDDRILNLSTLKFENGLGGLVFKIIRLSEALVFKFIIVYCLEECASSVTGFSR